MNPERAGILDFGEGWVFVMVVTGPHYGRAPAGYSAEDADRLSQKGR